MHTRHTMKSAEFSYTQDGRSVDFDAVFPQFTTTDRVGVVVHSPGAALRAAPVLLAAIGRFYEQYLASGNDFYAYPDYYIFHVESLCGYHGVIDIWPQHKEILVEPDPEAVLSAVNDRGITRLLVQDQEPRPGRFLRETVESARTRIRDAYVFNPHVRTNGSFRVTPSSAAANLISAAAEASRCIVGDSVAGDVKSGAAALQAFTRRSIDDVISVICGLGSIDHYQQMSAEYRAAHFVDESVLERHLLHLEPGQ